MTLRFIIAAAGPAAVPVRLRDQRQSQEPADRPAVGRPFEIRAHPHRGAAEHRLLRHPHARLGGRGRARAGPGRGAVRHRTCRRISTAPSIAAKFRQSSIDADATDPSAIGNATAALGAALDARSTATCRRSCRRQPANAAVPVRRPRPLQSRATHRAQHRAGPDLHRADDVDAVHDDACRSPASASAAPWKTCSPCRCGRSRSCSPRSCPTSPSAMSRSLLILVVSALFFHAADARLAAAAAGRARAFHRQQSGAGHHLLDARDEPDAGDAVGAVHADAVVPAVGLHVPVPRHAGLGAMGRRDVPARPTPCASCAACCSKATASTTSCRISGRSPLFTLVVIGIAVWCYRETLD